MTARRDNERRDSFHVAEGALEGLRQIDDYLLASLEEDVRFASGVPEGQRSSDLDFIQMTGLTRPQYHADKAASTFASADAELGGAMGANFFESGAADVDAAMTSGALQQESLLVPRYPAAEEHEIEAAARASASFCIAELEGILRDLSQTEAPLQEALEKPLAERSVAEAMDAGLLDAATLTELRDHRTRTVSESPGAAPPDAESLLLEPAPDEPETPTLSDEAPAPRVEDRVAPPLNHDLAEVERLLKQLHEQLRDDPPGPALFSG